MSDDEILAALEADTRRPFTLEDMLSDGQRAALDRFKQGFYDHE